MVDNNNSLPPRARARHHTEAGWDRYQKLVLEKLDTHGDRLDALDKKVTTVRIEIAGLKIKSGLWGAVAGLVPALAALVYMLMK